MFKYYGLLGLSLSILAMILISFNPYIPNFIIVLINFIGLWLFFDAVDFKLNHTSILHKIKKVHSLLFYILIIGFLISLVSEFYGAYITGLWGNLYYSKLAGLSIIKQIFKFLTGMLIGYGGPFLLTITVYRVVYFFIKKEIPILKSKFNLKKDEKYVFSYIGLIGLILLIIPIILFYFSKNWTSLYRGLLFGFTLIGFWFLLEYVEYKKHESSLLKDILEFKSKYIIAVVVTSVVVALLVEGFNLLLPAWQYKNIPLSQFNLFGIPIIIIVGWMPLVIIYLSFYRGFLSKKDVLF